MKRFALTLGFVFLLSLLASGLAFAADDSKVKAATEQVERGAKKIPDVRSGKASKRPPRASAIRFPKVRSTAVKS